MIGMKFDSEKPNCGLVYRGFSKALIEVARVGTFGAKKYAPDSWKGVEQERYVSALFRHLLAWLDGEKYDNESGFNHLSHVAWNALAICDMEMNKPVEPSDIKYDGPRFYCDGSFVDLPKATRNHFMSGCKPAIDNLSEWDKSLQDEPSGKHRCNDLFNLPNFVSYDKALMEIACLARCNNCDGCGYENGCMDEHCATFIANRTLEKVRGEE